MVAGKCSQKFFKMEEHGELQQDLDNSPLCERHSVRKESCIECGIGESVRSSEKLLEKYAIMDNYLKKIGKCTVSVEKDGHCLVKSVYQSLLERGIMKELKGYRALLTMVSDHIISEKKHYANYISCSEEEIVRELEDYKYCRNYTKSMVDLVLIALANVAKCTVIVYYVDAGNVEKHIIPPSLNSTARASVEVSFIDKHYDVIFDAYLASQMKDREIIVITDSPVKEQDDDCVVVMTVPSQRVKVEDAIKVKNIAPKVQIKFEEAYRVEDDFISSSNESISDDSNEIEFQEVSYRGNRRYINPDVFDNVDHSKASSVPDDIDGIKIYVVPMEENGTFKNCKGGRPWDSFQTSNKRGIPKGSRYIANCRGSYVCSNFKCENIEYFGINRREFIQRESKVLCEVCGHEANFIQCDARLILEKDKLKKEVTVKHYGSHTCPVEVRGRVNRQELDSVFHEYPKMTRETLIRQKVQHELESGNLETAKNAAKHYTDVKYIDNVKMMSKMSRRPAGHSFEAVMKLKENFEKQDKYMLFDLGDGAAEASPFVVKSSKLKVQLLADIDKDSGSSLSAETVFLDVVHSRCKDWKTYTLSFYCKTLREQIKLVTMETDKENGNNCELFFRKINEMLREYTGNEMACFNPFHLKDDEHGGNKIGMAKVFGTAFVEERTSSCDFHYDLSTENHKRFVEKADRKHYQSIALQLKEAVTVEGYYDAKKCLETLIERQRDGDKKPLLEALKFWHQCRRRWATAFKDILHNAPRSSLAEVAHASMTAGGDKGLSLVDAAMADITDSIRLQAKWENREAGESARGSGPTGLNLLDRNESRQIGRAMQFIDEEQRLNLAASPDVTSNCNVNDILDPGRSHRPDKRLRETGYSISSDGSEGELEGPSSKPPKVKKQRLRSLGSKEFLRALKRAKRLSGKIKILKHEVKDNMVDITVMEDAMEDGHIQNVVIGQMFRCDCSYQQAKRRTCCHIVWCLMKLFDVKEDEPVLAQLEVGLELVKDLIARLPDEVPQILKEFSGDHCNRSVDDRIKDHPKFNDEQKWMLSRKSSTKSSRCSGCLQPGAIKFGDLHLVVKGLLLLDKTDEVRVVHTDLRFHLRKKCVTNIISSKHNIRPIEDMTLKKDPFLRVLGDEEKQIIAKEGFKLKN